MRINVNVAIPDGITCIGCPYYDVKSLHSNLFVRSCNLLLKSDIGYVKPTVKFEQCKRLIDGGYLMLEDNHTFEMKPRHDGRVL